MEYNHKYNKDTDFQPVVPHLSINIAQAIETGVVLDTGTVGEYNEIDDPNGVWTRVRDAFQAVDVQRSIKTALSSAQSAASNNSATAAAPAESSAV